MGPTERKHRRMEMRSVERVLRVFFSAIWRLKNRNQIKIRPAFPKSSKSFQRRALYNKCFGVYLYC